MTKFSSQSSDPAWVKAATLPTGSGAYTKLSEFVERRYGDLPNLLTARTHEATMLAEIPANESSIKGVFPPIYNYSNAVVNGVRTYQGWTRDSALFGPDDRQLFATSFIPFKAQSGKSAGKIWCEAPSSKDVIRTIGGIPYTTTDRWYGVKDSTVDIPKNAFTFSVHFNEDVPSNVIAEDIEYLGVEVTGIMSQASGKPGFLMRDSDIFGASDPTIETFGGTSLDFSNLFKVRNYPFIRSKLVDVPALNGGQVASWDITAYQSYKPVVVRDPYTNDSIPFAFSLGLSNDTLVRTSGGSKVAISSPSFIEVAKGLGATPALVSADVEVASQYRIFSLGYFRPYDLMVQPTDQNKWNSNPALFNWYAKTPGVYSDPLLFCDKEFKMLAIPKSEADTILRDSDDDKRFPDKSLFVWIKYSCDNIQVATKPLIVVRRLEAGGLTQNLFGSKNENSVSVGFQNTANNLKLNVGANGTNGATQITFSNVKQTVIGGESIIKSGASYEFVGLKAPKIRSRSSEWVGRYKTVDIGAPRTTDNSVNISWPSSIQTTFTNEVAELSTAPNACAPAFLRDGAFGTQIHGPPVVSISNGSSSMNCAESDKLCVLNDEEISLFTKTKVGSTVWPISRPALRQYTPWTYELARGLPKTGAAELASWTTDQDAAVPSCSMFDGNHADYAYKGSGTTGLDFTVALNNGRKDYSVTLAGSSKVFLSLDPAKALSDSCIEWDSINGHRCVKFSPAVPVTNNTILGMTTPASSYTFGGAWTNVTVETATRLAQDCVDFDADGYCTDGTSTRVDPTPKSGAVTYTCGATNCPIPTVTSSNAVDTSTTVSGQPGEDGTNAGTATVFCRGTCNVSFFGSPGAGGRGSAPISSTRSKVLTCARPNNNNVQPVFQVRTLWSQPFSAGAQGSNGRNGQAGAGLSIYQELTPEALWEISQKDFWLNEP
ncbi:MAG: hypothetical protein EOP06_02405 [Proteobacteria bacterium]|nr:MAG: hypothetical protein EOP06_02405 [Pseudomonadota bacterium]